MDLNGFVFDLHKWGIDGKRCIGIVAIVKVYGARVLGIESLAHVSTRDWVNHPVNDEVLKIQGGATRDTGVLSGYGNDLHTAGARP